MRHAYSEKLVIFKENNEPSMTKQNELDNANINSIVKRHMSIETLTELDSLELQFGEITSTDLLDAKKMIMESNEAFYKLPSSLRKQFGQDAGAFIDFATDPENLDQMVEWGLAKKPVVVIEEDLNKPSPEET